jgi:hypothetical protein
VRICSLFASALAVVVAVPLSAQSCLGLPDGSPVNARVAITPDDGATRLSGRVGALLKQAFFGISGDYTSVPFFDGSIRTAGGDLGYQISLNEKKTAYLCPLLGASYSTFTIRLPNIFGENPFADESLGDARGERRTMMAGVGIGGAMAISPTVDLVPFANLGFVRVREDTSDPLSILDPLGEASLNDVSRTFGLLGVGLGLQFSHRYTVTIAMTQTVAGGGGSSSQMTMGGAMGFGKR